MRSAKNFFQAIFELNGKIQYKIGVVPMFKQLSTNPWRRMREWRFSFAILELGTRWMWVIGLTLRLLYLRGKDHVILRIVDLVNSRASLKAVE
jgi:hypothetical protein